MSAAARRPLASDDNPTAQRRPSVNEHEGVVGRRKPLTDELLYRAIQVGQRASIWARHAPPAQKYKAHHFVDRGKLERQAEIAESCSEQGRELGAPHWGHIADIGPNLARLQNDGRTRLVATTYILANACIDRRAEFLGRPHRYFDAELAVSSHARKFIVLEQHDRGEGVGFSFEERSDFGCQALLAVLDPAIQSLLVRNLTVTRFVQLEEALLLAAETLSMARR